VKRGLRQSMAWLHTWTGLLLGWLLYFMFITGTVGYLDTEIDQWMQPEAPLAIQDMTPTRAVSLGRDWLQAQAPSADEWRMLLPADRNTPYLRLIWRGAEGESGSVELDGQGWPLEARDTGGGQFLYQMHWRLHYLPSWFTGWLISAVTLIMFVALVTGVIIHKRIFKEFFTFRPGKGQRSWLDAHNALSVLSLPFQLMITYSGLVFMMVVFMPLIITAFYGSADQAPERFLDEASARAPKVKAAGRSADLVDLAPLIARAEGRWGGGQISRVTVNHPGDANARIRIEGLYSTGPLRTSPGLTFDGVSGELLHERPNVGSVAKNTRDVLLGLHEGLFAGPVLRALYVLSGLMGTAMIGTGLILWTVKCRQRLVKQGSAGARGVALVERLNVGTVVGLPVAITAYFWANRLIPVGIEGRGDWEADAMFITWTVMLLHALLRPRLRVWVEQLWVASAAFGLLPLLNVMTTDRHLGKTLPAGIWNLAGFDLTVLIFGIAFAITAWRRPRGSDARDNAAAWESRPRSEAAE